jgi:hypothetical protein
MTALAVNTPRSFYGGNAELWGEFPVAAGVNILEGANLGFDTDGNLVLLSAATYPFAGVSVERADNTLGIAGDKKCKVKLQSTADIDVVGVASGADKNKPFYASDSGTYTLTPTSAVKCGKTLEWISGTTIKVLFRSCLLRDGVDLSQIAALAGTLTGTVDGTVVDVAAAAAATAGGATPSAGQVDAGIATALAPVVAGINTQNKEMQTQINAILAALKL